MRLARTRAAMASAGIDVLLVHSLPDICYLTGFQTPLSDWYSCLVLPLRRASRRCRCAITSWRR